MKTIQELQDEIRIAEQEKDQADAAFYAAEGAFNAAGVCREKALWRYMDAIDALVEAELGLAPLHAPPLQPTDEDDCG